MKIRHLFSLALDFIYKKRGAYLLSIVIGIILCYFVDLRLVGYDSSLYTQKKVEGCFTEDLDEIYHVYSDQYQEENYDAFRRELYQLEGFEAYGVFEDTTTYFWERGVDYSPYFAALEERTDEEQMDTKPIDISESCASLLNIVDENGNALKGGKEGEPVPVYIGSRFKETLPVGTILKFEYPAGPIDEDTDFDTVEFLCDEYVIAGVLAEGQEVLPSNIIENQDGTKINLDYEYVGVKAGEEMLSSPEFYFTAEEPGQMEEKIKQLAENYGIEVEVSTIQDTLDDMKRERFSDLKYNGVMLALILCMAVIAISSASVMMLMIRKNSIGILYANGVTRRNMSAVIGIINFLCTLISGILAFALRTLRLKNVYMREDLAEEFKMVQEIRLEYVSWQIGVLCIGIALLSWFLSVRIINRYSIRQLIGNNE